MTATKKIDPRSPRQKARDAAYAALPVARIEKPLRFIDNATGQFVTKKGALDGRLTSVWQPSEVYGEARLAAHRGDGTTVNRIAREAALA